MRSVILDIKDAVSTSIDAMIVAGFDRWRVTVALQLPGVDRVRIAVVSQLDEIWHNSND